MTKGIRSVAVDELTDARNGLAFPLVASLAVMAVVYPLSVFFHYRGFQEYADELMFQAMVAMWSIALGFVAIALLLVVWRTIRRIRNTTHSTKGPVSGLPAWSELSEETRQDIVERARDRVEEHITEERVAAAYASIGAEQDVNELDEWYANEVEGHDA